VESIDATVAGAIVTVLRLADGPLHWTVIQDRALREGYLDPFAITDVRGEVLSALRTLSDRGDVERVDKGTYVLGRPAGERTTDPTEP
jgi:hypothetical protein